MLIQCQSIDHNVNVQMKQLTVLTNECVFNMYLINYPKLIK